MLPVSLDCLSNVYLKVNKATVATLLSLRIIFVNDFISFDVSGLNLFRFVNNIEMYLFTLSL